jgi:hypothetical protein
MIWTTIASFVAAVYTAGAGIFHLVNSLWLPAIPPKMERSCLAMRTKT